MARRPGRRSRAAAAAAAASSTTLLVAAFVAAAIAPFAAARPTPYPPGTCTTECYRPPPPPCPDQTCAISEDACPALHYPAAQTPRDRTYCVAIFLRKCDQQAGCIACALWQSVTRHCTGLVPNTYERCEDRGDVVVLRSRERDAAFDGQLCLTLRHWLIVPKIACTGVEDDDPRCTGLQAENFWRLAWDEALLKGFSPDGSDGGDGSFSPSWAIVLSPPHMRSQHQLHLRLAPFGEVDSGITKFRAYAGRISADPRRPTLIRGDAAENTLLASVWVPAPVRDRGWSIATRVRPFEKAAIMARNVRPGRPYGVMLTGRWQQEKAGHGGKRRRGKKEWGYVVTTLFNVGSSRILDETLDPNDGPEACVDGCYMWQ